MIKQIGQHHVMIVAAAAMPVGATGIATAGK
jgi:hypothetical protein